MGAITYPCYIRTLAVRESTVTDLQCIICVHQVIVRQRADWKLKSLKTFVTDWHKKKFASENLTGGYLC